MSKHEHTWRIVHAAAYDPSASSGQLQCVRVQMGRFLPSCGMTRTIQFDTEELEAMAQAAPTKGIA